MSAVDLLFPVLGYQLPTDHQYPLYAAVTTLLPWLHGTRSPYSLAPLTGEYVGDGRLRLLPGWSKLRSASAGGRHSSGNAASGKRAVRRRPKGPPRSAPRRGVGACTGAAGSHGHDQARNRARRLPTSSAKQLDALVINGRIKVPLVSSGPHQGQARRHVLRVQHYAIIGYPLLVSDLTPDESLRLQGNGIGGKRHMGGGFFAGDISGGTPCLTDYARRACRATLGLERSHRPRSISRITSPMFIARRDRFSTQPARTS